MSARMRSEDYWNRNIGEWGKFYLNLSHSGEALDAPGSQARSPRCPQR
jgi:hypothetical protein